MSDFKIKKTIKIAKTPAGVKVIKVSKPKTAKTTIKDLTKIIVSDGSAKKPVRISLAKRAAAVDANLGKGVPLSDFLKGTGW